MTSEIRAEHQQKVTAGLDFVQFCNIRVSSLKSGSTLFMPCLRENIQADSVS